MVSGLMPLGLSLICFTCVSLALSLNWNMICPVAHALALAVFPCCVPCPVATAPAALLRVEPSWGVPQGAWAFRSPLHPPMGDLQPMAKGPAAHPGGSIRAGSTPCLTTSRRPPDGNPHPAPQRSYPQPPWLLFVLLWHIRGQTGSPITQRDTSRQW